MRFVLAVLLASVCFGTTGTAQALGPEASAASVGAARILIGGGALALIAGLRIAAVRAHAGSGQGGRRGHRPDRRGGAAGTPLAAPIVRPRLPSWLVVVLGAAGVLGYQPAFFAGTAANGVAVGTVVALGSAPVITGALDWALRRRAPGRRWGVATAIATAGVAMLALASNGSGGSGAPGAGALGLAASIGAGASYAVYTLAGKALIDRGWRPESSMGALFGGAAVASLPVLALTDASWLASGDGLVMALWLGLVTTTIAYLLFGYGLTGLLPATVSTLTLAEPLTAGLLAVLVLGETLPFGAWLGLAVLAAGIGVLASAGRRTSRSATSAAVSEPAATVGAWTSSSSRASGSAPTPGGT